MCFVEIIRYSCIYEACMSPALDGSSVVRCFKCSNAIEIRDAITFVFYMIDKAQIAFRIIGVA